MVFPYYDCSLIIFVNALRQLVLESVPTLIAWTRIKKNLQITCIYLRISSKYPPAKRGVSRGNNCVTLFLQQQSRVSREIGNNDIRAGPLNRSQRLHHGSFAI